jgi:NAD(P)-dependent dehydrogenase (short-subunit alcohol dehydrogenase family)
VNIVINNAGFAAFTGAVTVDTIDSARQEMEVNYFGPLKLLQALRVHPIKPEGVHLPLSPHDGRASRLTISMTAAA